ncbi:mono/diheme cytochrome c family protein [Mesorhizobium loti]|jgi:mono/diheme cytochrome c family protein|uniref:Mono/diheme cytochrome c family protein n=1 Tax=Rhizobium loti TaxID=381 RepID=A0A8E2W5Q4_RHILI|nr:cytochrome c [Mesorhizobium loti]PWJ86011.1 mono/diheme cytochrome c family protein [Mesorhizobium loti]
MNACMSSDGHGRRLWVPALTVVLLGSVLPALADGVTEHGKALVEVNCARCHAIGETDKSSHPDAPAFRTLSKRYPITDLEEALAEGISTGHPDMPEWVASPDQIEAIIAYISSLQQP